VFESVPEHPLPEVTELHDPSPHWPWVFTPQQFIDELSRITQVCQAVPSISTAVLPEGMAISIEPLVTVPPEDRTVYDLPQHRTEPFSIIAHTLFPALAIETGLFPAE